MDYKELIERIEDSCEFAMAIEEDDLFTTLKDAANAIETLLAERDAAVKYIPKVCSTCKHWDSGGCTRRLLVESAHLICGKHGSGAARRREVV